MALLQACRVLHEAVVELGFCIQVEDFYFSSAAGRARIVLGNRRWGENGYVASGRQQARPVQRAASKVKCGLVAADQEMHQDWWHTLEAFVG